MTIVAASAAMPGLAQPVPAPLTRSAAEAKLSLFFDRVDTDGDARLSRQELYRANRGPAPAAEDGGLPGFDPRIWGYFDQDRDGYVTRSEAIARSKAMYDEADENGDGSLTYSERQQAQENALFGVCRARTPACRASERAAEGYRANFKAANVGLERFDWSTRATFRFNSGIREARYEAVRDVAGWRGLWDLVTAGKGPAPLFPHVDFGRQMILVAAVGQRPTTGYSVEIQSVRQSGPDLVATVIRTSPGRRCGTGAAVTQPADIVKMPASSRRVRWNMIDRVTNCP
jgi:hypothetical protein